MAALTCHTGKPGPSPLSSLDLCFWARIQVQVTIYRWLWIGQDDHLDQFEAYGTRIRILDHM